MHVGLVSQGDVSWALDIANDLHDAGVSVSLYLSERHTVAEVGDAERPVERLYSTGLLPQDCRVHLIRFPRRRDPRSLRMSYRLSRMLRQDGVDVAHILMGPDEIWLGVLACLLTGGVPVTSTMIVPEAPTGGRFHPRIIWAVNKLLVLGSDVIIVNSRDQIALTKKMYRVPSRRLRFVPVTAGRAARRGSGASVTEDSEAILFFGRADPHKGLEYLVQAQPLISAARPEARIVISAHGEHLESCLELIREPDRFEIHEGFVDGDTMAKYFRRASVVVLPYLSAASSGVLMTAYAFGKPVVATSIDGLAEYVQDGITGLLVPPRNVEKLAGAIVRLLSDDSLRRQAGDNALRWVEEQRQEATMRTIHAYEAAIVMH